MLFSLLPVHALQQGIDLTYYNSRMLILPTNLNCQWGGMGTVGCFGVSGGCHSWLNAPPQYLNLESMHHEIGHNLGAMHSKSYPNVEYGDYSCIMGSWIGTRYFNAPQGWGMGFYKSLKEYTSSSPTGEAWGGAQAQQSIWVPARCICI